MIKFNIGQHKSSIKTEPPTEGEMLETKVRRIMAGKEPIKDGAPIIYTELKDGVLAQYNVRTDKMEVALEAQDSIKRNMIAKRNETIKKEEEAKASETQGTEQSNKTA